MTSGTGIVEVHRTTKVFFYYTFYVLGGNLKASRSSATTDDGRSPRSRSRQYQLTSQPCCACSLSVVVIRAEPAKTLSAVRNDAHRDCRVGCWAQFVADVPASLPEQQSSNSEPESPLCRQRSPPDPAKYRTCASARAASEHACRRV